MYLEAKESYSLVAMYTGYVVQWIVVEGIKSTKHALKC